MKTKTAIIIILSVIVATTLCGCTHNNGNIGSLFGKWKLTSIEVENMQTPEIDGTIFWSFQNSTIEMQLLGDHQEETRAYGNWRSSGQTLFLDFSDSDMPPLPSLGLPAQCELQIIDGIGNTMILVYHPTPQQSLTYKFIKY